MKMSFEELIEDCKDVSQDPSASATTLFKRGINEGKSKFGAILNREYRNTEKTFETVASQRYYQTPEDCLKVSSIVIENSGQRYPLTEIADNDEWNLLNSTDVVGGEPLYYYLKGSDQFGIWPIPSQDGDIGTVEYEPIERDMSVSTDYTAGTITVTNNSTTITGAGTTFTSNMVGRSIKIVDPNGDGMWYKIVGFTDATTLTIENYYSGATASGQSYKIGEVADIPQEYHSNLVDFALFRYFRMKKDAEAAQAHYSLFLDALASCRAVYSVKGTSQYMRKGPIYQTSWQYRNRKKGVS